MIQFNRFVKGPVRTPDFTTLRPKCGDVDNKSSKEQKSCLRTIRETGFHWLNPVK